MCVGEGGWCGWCPWLQVDDLDHSRVRWPCPDMYALKVVGRGLGSKEILDFNDAGAWPWTFANTVTRDLGVLECGLALTLIFKPEPANSYYLPITKKDSFTKSVLKYVVLKGVLKHFQKLNRILQIIFFYQKIIFVLENYPCRVNINFLLKGQFINTKETTLFVEFHWSNKN